jgi:hypothetical protein
MDYYVYVYLDPRSPGEYEYSEYTFEYEPFYVGKGRGWRFRNHLLKVKRGKYPNLPKFHIIKQILDSGNDPIIIKYKENMSEEESFLLEEDLINKIGRKDLKKGPLRNLSNGGEGNGDRKFTDEHRKNLSISKKGIVTENMKVHLDNLHRRLKGNKHTLGLKFSQETKDKMIKSRIKPIVKISLEGEILEEFTSIKEAMEKTNINPKRVLSGIGKTAGGFFWSYKEKVDD